MQYFTMRSKFLLICIELLLKLVDPFLEYFAMDLFFDDETLYFGLQRLQFFLTSRHYAIPTSFRDNAVEVKSDVGMRCQRFIGFAFESKRQCNAINFKMGQDRRLRGEYLHFVVTVTNKFDQKIKCVFLICLEFMIECELVCFELCVSNCVLRIVCFAVCPCALCPCALFASISCIVSHNDFIFEYL